MATISLQRPLSIAKAIILLKAMSSGPDFRRHLLLFFVTRHEGVEAYKKEGPKFMQRLVSKQKARVKDS
jgi:hypothetical protein